MLASARIPRMRRLVAGVAWIGFGLSAFVHAATLLGFEKVAEKFLFLHVGLVLLGVGLVMRRREELRNWKSAVPSGAVFPLQLGLLYFCLNFLALLFVDRAAPEVREARVATWQARMFSAGWMEMYALFASVCSGPTRSRPATGARSDRAA